MSSYEWALISMTGVLRRGKFGQRGRDTEGQRHEAEVGVLCPPAKEGPGLTATTRSQEEARKEASANTALPTLVLNVQPP